MRNPFVLLTATHFLLRQPGPGAAVVSAEVALLCFLWDQVASTVAKWPPGHFSQSLICAGETMPPPQSSLEWYFQALRVGETEAQRHT